MPDMRLTIGGRIYSVTCQPGEEQHLARLGTMLDTAARKASASGGLTETRALLFAGLLLAGSCSGPHISSYLADLASSSGRVVLIERAVRTEEIGIPLKEIKDGIGVRIYRDGKPYGFFDDESASLRAGDLIVVITQGDGRPPVTMQAD